MTAKRPSRKVNPEGAADFERRARQSSADALREMDPKISEDEIDERLAMGSSTIVAVRAKGIRREEFPNVERSTAPSDPTSVAKLNRWLPGAAIHGGRQRGTNYIEDSGGEQNVRALVAELRRNKRKVTASTVAAASGQFTESQLKYWLRTNQMRLDEMT